ncbi:MAG: hypothetical protein RL414_448 [Actinomycetota bacterium]
MAAFIGTFIIISAIVGSPLLAVPFAVGAAYVPYLFTKQKMERERIELVALWPEIIDHIISGLRSGLSLAETLIHLSVRGPEKSRPIFARCQGILRERGDFSEVFATIKAEFKDPIADQVCEVLDFARTSGSKEITTTLRTLGDFIRGDIAIRAEIRAKHGWIKNSAIVATLAPWILLLILSAQPSTIKAFSNGTGILVLIVGVAMSAIAFLWMARVGQIKVAPRIFRENTDGE